MSPLIEIGFRDRGTKKTIADVPDETGVYETDGYGPMEIDMSKVTEGKVILTSPLIKNGGTRVIDISGKGIGATLINSTRTLVVTLKSPPNR